MRLPSDTIRPRRGSRAETSHEARRARLVAVLTASVLMASAAGAAAPPAHGSQATPQAAVGEAAPRFFLPVIDGTSGVGATDWCGQPSRPMVRRPPKEVLVLAFFTTSCVPCRHELPELQALSRRYTGRLVRWYLVDVGDPADSVRAYARRMSLRMPVLHDLYRNVGGRYGSATPTVAVIDRDCILWYRHQGFRFDIPDSARAELADLAHAVDAALAMPADDAGPSPHPPATGTPQRPGASPGNVAR